MSTVRHIGKAALVMALTAASAHADGKLTWFGESNFSGAYPAESTVVTPDRESLHPKSIEQLTRRSPDWRLQSGEQLLERQLALDSVFDATDPDRSEGHIMRSELGVALGDEAISVPMYYSRNYVENGEARKLDSFGVKWRHKFGGLGSLTVQARYGKGAYQYADDSSQSAANRLATVSWTSGFEQSGVTGSLYIGDERYNEIEVSDNGRRIYGFAVGGHWSVASDHTPYVSLRYQTTDQQALTGMTDYDRYTRISAGWNWKVRSNWQVRAEANFTYDEPRWNLLGVDRTRIQFSTRYDLK
jgi:hypothetical protein